MPKAISAPILALPPRTPGEPAAAWLSSALRQEILEGRLRPGSRLPATRDLAAQYGLSRGTIVSASSAGSGAQPTSKRLPSRSQPANRRGDDGEWLLDEGMERAGMKVTHAL